jgi:hypothetical protein
MVLPTTRGLPVKMTTKINVKVELSVLREDEQIFILMQEMLIPILGDARVPLEESEQLGFEGLEKGEVCIDVLDAGQVPEGWTDEQILDAYFNSEYGVA